MSPTQLSTDSSILIIGCGTWGASTALHLARRGYRNVKVLDPYKVPSAISAGNDINKIKGFSNISQNDDASLEAWVRNKASSDATRAWDSDPIFKPFYHETGYLIAASQPKLMQELYDEEQPTP